MSEQSAENEAISEAFHEQADALAEVAGGRRGEAEGAAWREGLRYAVETLRQSAYDYTHDDDAPIPPDDCTCEHDHGVSTTKCDRCYWCQQETRDLPPGMDQ